MTDPATILRRMARDRAAPLDDSERAAMLAGAVALEQQERQQRSEDPTGRHEVPR